MRLNTDGEGLGAIFRDWQLPLIEEIFHRQETYTEPELREMSSSDAWHFLKERGIKTSRSNLSTVSRASVIIFLNDLHDAGMMNFRETTGKGGYRKLYEMRLTREQFNKTVIVKFVQKLMEIFPEESAHLETAVDAMVWRDLIA